MLRWFGRYWLRILIIVVVVGGLIGGWLYSKPRELFGKLKAKFNTGNVAEQAAGANAS